MLINAQCIQINSNILIALVYETINSNIFFNLFSLAHWEVYIENEHYKWFEEKTGDVDLMADVFNQVHALAPTTTLFLNEYQIVAKEGKATRVRKSSLRSLNILVLCRNISR